MPCPAGGGVSVAPARVDLLRFYTGDRETYGSAVLALLDTLHQPAERAGYTSRSSCSGVMQVALRAAWSRSDLWLLRPALPG